MARPLEGSAKRERAKQDEAGKVCGGQMSQGLGCGKDFVLLPKRKSKASSGFKQGSEPIRFAFWLQR